MSRANVVSIITTRENTKQVSIENLATLVVTRSWGMWSFISLEDFKNCHQNKSCLNPVLFKQAGGVLDQRIYPRIHTFPLEKESDYHHATTPHHPSSSSRTTPTPNCQWAFIIVGLRRTKSPNDQSWARALVFLHYKARYTEIIQEMKIGASISLKIAQSICSLWATFFENSLICIRVWCRR